MISFIKELMRWFSRAAERERDAYFSAAVDYVDLESRIRDWDHRPHIFGS